MKKKELTLEKYEVLGEQFNDIIDKITDLECNVLNFVGKTKGRIKANQIQKSKNSISDIRFQIEDEMYAINPKSPLITSFRKYRGGE